ncbi:ABC transporter ATP-binding protein [Mesoplasma syrphidae]|uniref:ABC transporter ATP-binding protein n=1 Tax=Mesoplasma syrphidae TaxID=225999 RepID=A0A2K9BUH3_9MOLU|nr:ABC transporter ATP-binding protein [Mesoplasma syrphidae]AUF83360.1 ABC transporter ATP-binding protein [Mesoplasma syrphidae]
MKIIQVANLTKIYSNGYGIYDIDLEVEEGRIFGYLGPNGAGKSTTIRTLMGYIKPNKGQSLINGLDTWTQAALVQNDTGYLPGEISFPDNMTGWKFIKLIYNLRNQKNWAEVEKLIAYWEFNPNLKIKKMSKGMKQKVGLVIAFMHNPKIVILDEPTAGLDPLMQQKFVDTIQRAKANGQTILMSSHIFEEVEKTCDEVAIIKSGRIISHVDLHELRSKNKRYYKITYGSDEFMQWSEFYTDKEKLTYIYNVKPEEVKEFFKKLANFKIEMVSEIPFSLEKYFMKFYKSEGESNV